jgi:hypothetical protein
MRALATAFLLSAGLASAQDSIFDKIQIHGALSQGALYSTGNSYGTTDSRNGSFRWTEGALNFGSSLTDQLRLGIQLHSYSFGEVGAQKVTLDWAFGDYKVNQFFGLRAGKVKTPSGLYNDIQDVDLLFPWALLPESVYPVDLRDLHLAHTGFVVYGAVHPGKRGGSIGYQVFAGSRSDDSNGGLSIDLAESGLILGDASGPTWGADVRWTTPVNGWLLGASYMKNDLKAPNAMAAGISTPYQLKYTSENFYSQYEYKKVTLSMEWNIEPSHERIGAAPVVYSPSRIWYFMGTYRIKDKWSVGSYYSTDWGPDGNRDRSDPNNFSHDTALNTRVDINSYFYVKAEGHYIDGDADGLYQVYNPHGLERITRLYVARFGFAF